MKKLILASLIPLVVSGTAVADQIYIDNGIDYGGNNSETAAGDSTTGWKDSLTLKYVSNSTVFDLDGDFGISAGDTILSSGGLIGGGVLANNLVTALIDKEVFGTGPSDNDYGNDWVLSFRFDDLMGTFDGTDFNYTSGTIDWILFDSTNGIGTEVHLFTMTLEDHFYTTGNQVFSGTLGNFGVGSVNGVDIGDIFNIKVGAGAMSFEDYANADVANKVNFRIDQNTDVPNVTGTDFSGEVGEIYISGEHDGSLEFSIPEPASIAILGLSLLGLAGASRRRT